MTFKCTNFDINRNVFEDYIPYSDSFVPKIRYDRKEHAIDLIAVYCTDEYWRFFNYMEYMRHTDHGDIYT